MRIKALASSILCSFAFSNSVSVAVDRDTVNKVLARVPNDIIVHCRIDNSGDPVGNEFVFNDPQCGSTRVFVSKDSYIIGNLEVGFPSCIDLRDSIFMTMTLRYCDYLVGIFPKLQCDLFDNGGIIFNEVYKKIADKICFLDDLV